MANSDAGICNLALNLIGETSIVSLSDQNERARACNVFYAQTRDEVLRAYPWNFAKKEANLALTTTSPLLTWSYAYQLPTDYLCARKTESNTVYEIVGDKLYSNEDTLIFKYIRKETDPTKFDANFVNALSAKMAMKLSYKLSDSKTLQELMAKLYIEAIQEARGVDSQEDTPEDLFRDFLSEARSGSSYYEGYGFRSGLDYEG